MESPLQPGQLFGDFRIRKLIGRGRAGFVYSADDLLAKRRCALKLLCRMSSHDLYRNKLGFRRMSPFRQSTLMRTDRIELIEGHTVLLMEEIDGETLYLSARRLKDLPADQAYRRLHALLHDYATGLAAMHFGGLIHRDLKPTNLMVRSNGQGVIVDYGLVASCDPERDPYGLRDYIAGTPRYFSPEALWEQSYTPAGDVFSLGLVVLDCLNVISGSNQWLRRGDFADWVRDEDEQIIADAISDIHADVPAVLRKVVAGMLRSDRMKRPSSFEVVEMTKSDDRPVRLTSMHHLFGRERELDECEEWIRRIYRGRTGRLHLYGEAGSGKTRLLDEIERKLRQNNWGQVFRVRCRSREMQTLQVMDQISDQIAQRYSRGDRDPLTLDPVSASILIQAFPQLRHVIVQNMHEASAPFPDAPERLDALTAAARLSRELRKVGPLIIIIDDAQWSDHDSNTIWDELQKDSHGFLGIITCSREPETTQRQPADLRIHIGPLSKESSLSFLNTSAKRWGANINPAGLKELVEVSRCNAFRLHELAEEFRPGGMLHRVEQSSDASISNLGDVDRFWRIRFDRLSDEAHSILAYIVTAAAPVSISQLTELTDLGEKADASVSELVSQRLVNDDASGKECITVVHDRIAKGLIENISETELHRAHLQWAKLLSGLNRPRDYASRIAAHYYAAGQNGAALPYAIMAAENADRAFMKFEAGEWHERVLLQVTGDACEKHRRDAARCFHEADLPERAATHYLLLADLVSDPAEQCQFKTLAAQLLVRAGNMEQARPLVEELKTGFRLPQVATANRDLAYYGTSLAAFATRLTDSLRDPLIWQELADQAGRQSALQFDDVCCLSFCSEVSRSLAMLDFQGTADLVIHGAQLAERIGTAADRLHFGTMAWVWNSMLAVDQFDSISAGRKSLQELLKRFRNLPGSRLSAEVRSGLAFVEMYAMNWRELPKVVDACVVDFIADDEPLRFEVAHTRWLKIWADWHLGNWSNMRTMSQDMAEDAARRNDSYQQLVATSGFGGNAWLISDDVLRLDQYANENERVVSDTGRTEFVHFFRWMSRVQRAIYLADWSTAAANVVHMQANLEGTLISHLSQVQTTTAFLTALVSLHVRGRKQSPGLEKRRLPLPLDLIADPAIVAQAIDSLSAQPYEFARMLAALLSGIDRRIAGDLRASQDHCRTAASLARDHGWLPYQLAAEDGLHPAGDSSRSPDSLHQQMILARVKRPKHLARLYTA